MALNKAVFENNEVTVTLRRIYAGGWYVQVMQGVAGTHHVETTEFASYEEALNYAVDKYNLTTD